MYKAIGQLEPSAVGSENQIPQATQSLVHTVQLGGLADPDGASCTTILAIVGIFSIGIHRGVRHAA